MSGHTLVNGSRRYLLLALASTKDLITFLAAEYVELAALSGFFKRANLGY
jgi:hypothetical protein